MNLWVIKMFDKIVNYFSSLNGAGQALFVVGILLVVTFIILLIVVFKPEKKPKKIYGENKVVEEENTVLEKLKDINNVSVDDINLDNSRTKNLKSIVDELKSLENNPTSYYDMIEKYEDEQENTAVISVSELLRAKDAYNYSQTLIRRNAAPKKEVSEPVSIEPQVSFEHKQTYKEEYLFEEDTAPIKKIQITEEKKYTPSKEIFSSVFSDGASSKDHNDEKNSNEKFLSTLKEFRNNL